MAKCLFLTAWATLYQLFQNKGSFSHQSELRVISSYWVLTKVLLLFTTWQVCHLWVKFHTSSVFCLPSNLMVESSRTTVRMPPSNRIDPAHQSARLNLRVTWDLLRSSTQIPPSWWLTGHSILLKMLLLEATLDILKMWLVFNGWDSTRAVKITLKFKVTNLFSRAVSVSLVVRLTFPSLFGSTTETGGNSTTSMLRSVLTSRSLFSERAVTRVQKSFN